MIRSRRKGSENRGVFSLLWPSVDGRPAVPEETHEISADASADLGISVLLEAFTGGRHKPRDIEQVLMRLPSDPNVIVYRQDVFQDIMANPSLMECLRELYPSIEVQDRYLYGGLGGSTAFHEMIFRLEELTAFVTCVEGLRKELARLGERLVSEGFRSLRERIVAIAEDETFRRLVRELPEIDRRARTVRSITVGINLDARLVPHEAVLVSVDRERFGTKPGGLLDLLTGKKGSGLQGIGPMHSVPAKASGRVIAGRPQYEYDPLLMPLFRDLSDIMNKTALPIIRELKRYASIGAGLFSGLRPEILFYLQAADFIRKMTDAGLPFCKPAILPPDDGVIKIRDSYNLLLALSLISDADGSGTADSPYTVTDELVLNDIEFDTSRGIQILTGPNQGGKTVYVQSVGLALLLGQAGLFMPGRSAEISPVDRVLTHFQIEERPEGRTGRFGDEAKRLSDIFRQATPRSLVLMNESLSSTSGDESMYIAEDLIRAFRLLGCRVLFATHLHELANRAGRLACESEGVTGVISLVAGVDPDSQMREGVTRRTYKIVPGPPMGHSYATEIAAKYGVSFEQLSGLIHERGYGDAFDEKEKQEGEER